MSEDKKTETKVETKPSATAEIKPGMTVKIHQQITEQGPKGEKKRIQIFEGIVLAHKHGKEQGATITVRKISDGIGVEKIFPIHSPNVVKIEPVKQAKVRKAKLYYLRTSKKRLKETKVS
jgi:large subunit ribosomal protein L19